ncbi:unnamed protein product [Protopolystoma xenopodis]|uniref:Uncharacterized protein n=1 Tax=Protopolystoma xenopodis TaxID=117903 RepID=A0A3S5AEU6_9PLAT|nr:unnamed protein product [Protopolystoma xenopodis]
MGCPGGTSSCSILAQTVHVIVHFGSLMWLQVFSNAAISEPDRVVVTRNDPLMIKLIFISGENACDEVTRSSVVFHIIIE